MKLVLASTSRYRRELLGRLHLPFEAVAPHLDETPLEGEAPTATALRLAEGKARAVAPGHPDSLIIGSDQVATLGNTILGKPGNRENAQKQLRAMRGHTVVFNTALALLNTATNRADVRLVPFAVAFRNYTDQQIERYLDLEQPYDCAGSAKSEGLGIALIARMEGTDPSALVGLPLIELVDMLATQGLAVL